MRDRQLGKHPRVDETNRLRCEPPPQHRGEVAGIAAHGDRREVGPLGERAVDGAGPADDGDDLVVARLQRQARREPVGGAVGVEPGDRLAARFGRIGRREDARAHPPQRAVAHVVREQPAARDDEAGRIERERGQRLGRLGRQGVVVDRPPADRSEPLDGMHAREATGVAPLRFRGALVAIRTPMRSK